MLNTVVLIIKSYGSTSYSELNRVSIAKLRLSEANNMSEINGYAPGTFCWPEPVASQNDNFYAALISIYDVVQS